jgi:hypothetical protein
MERIMTLNDAIARDPPKTRCFRLLAPVLILLGLALLAMVPGMLIHFGDVPDQEAVRSIDRSLTYEGR